MTVFNKNKGVKSKQLQPNYFYHYTCSSFHQSMNPDLVENIWATKKILWYHYNVGITNTNIKYDLGTLEAWLNESGIANITSFDKVQQVYPITNYHVNNVFSVHNKGIGSREGKYSSKQGKEGFPYFYFTDHKDAVILVNIIGEHFGGFTNMYQVLEVGPWGRRSYQ